MQTAVVEVDADPPAHSRDPEVRRRVGFALLVVALIAALCLPGLLGRRAAGVPTTAPPVPPPVPGQCRAPVEKDVEIDRLTGTALIDCADPHSAEIVSIGSFVDVDSYPDSSSSSAVGAAVAGCEGQVAGYVGKAAPWQQGTPVPHAPPETTTQITVPSRHQWASGQHWYACQVRPALDALPIVYTGSVRQAATDVVPVAYARCASVIGGPAVPCAEPHNAQKLSMPVAGRDRIDCHEVSRLLTGSDDPTFGGQLSQTGWQETNGRVACWATTTTGRPLVGSLLGWGDQPLTTG